MERKGGDDDEKTSTVATAAVVDRLSGLPEDILHHILSSLDTKEVIKTSVLSKTFMSLWLSFPVLDFEYYTPSNYGRYEYEYIRKAKDKYLDQINRITQQRCQNPEAPFLQKYRLCLDGSYIEETDNRINAAINYAINDGRVEELVLHIYNRVSLPNIAFETSITSLSLAGLKVNKLSEFLGHCPLLENLELINCYGPKYLKIFGSKIKFIDLEMYQLGTESIEIHSPALQLLKFNNSRCCKTFSISNSCNSLKEMKLQGALITDEWIQELLPGLVLLETLSFFRCNELKNIKISNPNLKSVTLTWCEGLEGIEVRVIDLESFEFEGSENDQGTCKINIVHCKHLRQLSMHGCGFPEEFLQEQVPKLLELERLKLDLSSFKGSLEICHQNLMHLEILNWRTVLKIDTPKLDSFSYRGSCMPFVSFQYNAILSAKLVPTYDCVDDPSYFKKWYELIRFMDRCKVLKLGGEAANFIFPQQLRKELVSPLVNLRHMRVEIGWLEMSAELVDSLLWLSPFLETLVFVGRFHGLIILSIKFDYMWTENKDDENPLVAVSAQSVRHYSYREVEIEIFRDLVIEKDDLVKYFKDEVKSLRIIKSKSCHLH